MANQMSWRCQRCGHRTEVDQAVCSACSFTVFDPISPQEVGDIARLDALFDGADAYKAVLVASSPDWPARVQTLERVNPEMAAMYRETGHWKRYVFRFTVEDALRKISTAIRRRFRRGR